MSGDWPPGGQLPVPPEWEDPEDEFPEGLDQLDTEAGARLSEVTAYLASLPAPVLPDAVEARISAALAAEAAARAGDSGQAGLLSPGGGAAPGAAPPADGTRTLPLARPRWRVRRHRSGGGGRRALRSRPAMAVGSVIVCLILAGLGYGLSRGGGSPAESSGPSILGIARQGSTAAAPAASAPAAPASSAAGASGAASMPFAVTASGTRYQAATLASQARARLAASPPGSVEVPGRVKPSSVPAPSSSSLAARNTSAPTAALRGCVAHLTGGRSPRLVDRATYQGEPAYIIVGSAKVWVVGLGCTARNPELIASVPLGA